MEFHFDVSRQELEVIASGLQPEQWVLFNKGFAESTWRQTIHSEFWSHFRP